MYTSYTGKTRKVFLAFASFLDSLKSADVQPPNARRSAEEFLRGPYAFASALRDAANIRGMTAEQLCGVVLSAYRVAAGTAVLQIVVERCDPNRVLEPVVVSLTHPSGAFKASLVLAPAYYVASPSDDSAEGETGAYSRIDFEGAPNSSIGRAVGQKLAECFS